jgi:hypothetical protein
MTVVWAIPGRANCLFAENESAVFGDKITLECHLR